MKKLTAMLLIFLLSFSTALISPITQVKADDNLFEVNGFEYKKLGNDEVCLFDYSYTSDIDRECPVFPSEVDYEGITYKITQIELNRRNPFVKKLIFPEGVKKIELNELGAWDHDCPLLEEIHFPSTLESVNEGFSFAMPSLKTITIPESNPYYKVVDGVFFDKDGENLHAYPAALEHKDVYTVPEGVTKIISGSFSYVKNLDSVVMSSTVKKIAGNVFNESKIQSIDLNQAESVGNECFAFCKDLHTVKLGPNTTFKKYVFYENDALKNIIVPKENRYYETVDGVLFCNTNYGRTLYCYPAAKEETEYSIPEGTKYLSYSAFSLCNHLDKIIIPKTVIKIGTAAFNFTVIDDMGKEHQGSVKPISLIFASDELPEMTGNTFCDLYTGSKICFKDYADPSRSLIKQFEAKNQSDALIFKTNASDTIHVEALPAQPATSFSLEKESMDLTLMNWLPTIETLTYTLQPVLCSDRVTFQSSSPDVASVDGFGRITAGVPGKTTITATARSFQKQCEVHVRADIAGRCDIQSVQAKSVWTGKPVEAYVFVVFDYDEGKRQLEEGKDFLLSYKNNVQPGTGATVTIQGIGDFSGSVDRTYEIKKYNQDPPDATTETPKPTPVPKPVKKKITYASAPSNSTYTGKSITKSLTVKAGSTKLKLNRDYRVKYTSNKNCGKAKMVITGNGNYTGSFTRYFKILPKKAKLKKLKAGKKKITATWYKNGGSPTGYQIRYSAYKNFKKSKYKDTSKSSYTIKGLKRKKYCYVKIRAYKTIDKKKCYGSYSSYKRIKVK